MRKTLFLIAAAWAIPTFAAETSPAPYRFTKKVNVHMLRSQLTAAGFKARDIGCKPNNDCAIHWTENETKDPASIIAAHAYIDDALLDADNKAEIRRLGLKWKKGVISAAEKDDLLMRLVIQQAGIRPWE